MFFNIILFLTLLLTSLSLVSEIGKFEDEVGKYNLPSYEIKFNPNGTSTPIEIKEYKFPIMLYVLFIISFILLLNQITYLRILYNNLNEKIYKQ